MWISSLFLLSVVKLHSSHLTIRQPICSQFSAHWMFCTHSSTCTEVSPGASLGASCRMVSEVSWVAGWELCPGAGWEVSWETVRIAKEISRSATGVAACWAVVDLGASGVSCSTTWGGFGLLIPPAPLSEVTAPCLNSWSLRIFITLSFSLSFLVISCICCWYSKFSLLIYSLFFLFSDLKYLFS